MLWWLSIIWLSALWLSLPALGIALAMITHQALRALHILPRQVIE